MKSPDYDPSPLCLDDAFFANRLSLLEDSAFPPPVGACNPVAEQLRLTLPFYLASNDVLMTAERQVEFCGFLLQISHRGIEGVAPAQRLEKSR
jgi:hypothetical protein